ncbi:YozQ family protein [Brevibacillus marinus]|uniref:YozQ family protein n=1 Tax=Brevibacillus marinus TaxID=2496837 RepID=UPI000F846E47|nr:YozQ family protein [Brevibacillus marinus]
MGQSNARPQETAKQLASESYDVSDHHSEDPVSRGLAVTHEQVSDSYLEGTNDGRVDQNGEKDAEIPREGYEGMFK